MSDENNLRNTGNFIHQFINDDLKGDYDKLLTRFPPEPNGYLHIGHAKSICLNFGLTEMYGGKTNLRFDDTNPKSENNHFVEAIKKDIKWLGFDWEDRLFFGSDYFDKMYKFAIGLIKDDKAFVCDLNSEEVKQYRGDFNIPGKESPYRNRTIEENLELFEKMKNGEFEDGSKTLRGKINMSDGNINMRDPVLYRISRENHYRTGNEWIIYPMYDYAHPIQDALEGITHSICTLEFEDHKPLYNWVVNNISAFNNLEIKPRQIEFAKLYLTNTISGKRYIKKLVEDKVINDWDDPRLITLSGMRRRGYTPKAIREFCDLIGISKSNNMVEYDYLEYCVRNDLQQISTNLMAILNPLKIVITNYDEDKIEYLTVDNKSKDETAGTREIPFGREIYIEREDFEENPPNKYKRLTLDQEVRLMGAYFIKCNNIIKNENGEIIELHCTYDPETKSGSGFSGRKVKGTIHWVSKKYGLPTKINLYENLVFDDETVEGGKRMNPNSLIQIENAIIEPLGKNGTIENRYQFIRNGFYCLDLDSTPENLIFNRIVELKSSYKPQK